MKYRVIKDVTKQQCTWLKRDYKKGEFVYKYFGCTYGVCKDYAYTEKEGVTPFFELPNDAVEEVYEKKIEELINCKE